MMRYRVNNLAGPDRTVVYRRIRGCRFCLVGSDIGRLNATEMGLAKIPGGPPKHRPGHRIRGNRGTQMEVL